MAIQHSSICKPIRSQLQSESQVTHSFGQLMNIENTTNKTDAASEISLKLAAVRPG